MNGLDQLDPLFALFFGARSVWVRLPLLCAACWFGSLVGLFCGYFEETFETLLRGDFASVVGGAFGAIVWCPFIWVGLLFAGFYRSAAGILILPVLAVALLCVLYSEDRYWHGLFLVLAVQPIHSVWVIDRGGHTAWICLGVYLLVLARVYVWCWRVRYSSD